MPENGLMLNLRTGEPVPTLEEALECIARETIAVWKSKIR